MSAILDPAVDRFRELMERDEDEAELWRGKLAAFRNLYAIKISRCPDRVLVSENFSKKHVNGTIVPPRVTSAAFRATCPKILVTQISSLPVDLPKQTPKDVARSSFFRKSIPRMH